MTDLKDLIGDMATVKKNVDIQGLSVDSRTIKKGGCFLAYPRTKLDGRQFIEDAINQGAAAVLCEMKKADKRMTKTRKHSVPIYFIQDLASKVGTIASRFYLNASRDLMVIGVTGTNGKTSCSFLLAHALKKLGSRVAMIGTLGAGLLDEIRATQNTTPDAITLQRLFREFKNEGVDVVVMEVSSHALEQGRVNGVEFDAGVFTNLTQDHLDYHGDIEAYKLAKNRLFKMPSILHGVFNVDDKTGKNWLQEFRDHLLVCGYSAKKKSDIYVKNVTINREGIVANLITPWGEGVLQSHMMGKFNLSNLLAIVSILGILNYSLNEILAVIAQLPPVPGRLQFFGGDQKPSVVVDYAHTPDALEKVLKTLRPLCQGKLICVFGCGGDRDKTKRPKMAKIAEKLSREIILTDDNVRFEDAQKIIKDIFAGFKKPKKVTVEHDRRKAIEMAIKKATCNDMVLIAGKGHENYQIIEDRREPFNDIEVVEQALQTF